METIRGRKMSYGNCVTAEKNPSRNVIKLGKPWLREGYQSSAHELIMCILLNQLLDSNLSKEQKSSKVHMCL